MGKKYDKSGSRVTLDYKEGVKMIQSERRKWWAMKTPSKVGEGESSFLKKAKVII